MDTMNYLFRPKHSEDAGEELVALQKCIEELKYASIRISEIETRCRYLQENIWNIAEFIDPALDKIIDAVHAAKEKE